MDDFKKKLATLYSVPNRDDQMTPVICPTGFLVDFSATVTANDAASKEIAPDGLHMV